MDIGACGHVSVSVLVSLFLLCVVPVCLYVCAYCNQIRFACFVQVLRLEKDELSRRLGSTVLEPPRFVLMAQGPQMGKAPFQSAMLSVPVVVLASVARVLAKRSRRKSR